MFNFISLDQLFKGGLSLKLKFVYFCRRLSSRVSLKKKDILLISEGLLRESFSHQYMLIAFTLSIISKVGSKQSNYRNIDGNERP